MKDIFCKLGSGILTLILTFIFSFSVSLTPTHAVEDFDWDAWENELEDATNELEDWDDFDWDAIMNDALDGEDEELEGMDWDSADWDDDWGITTTGDFEDGDLLGFILAMGTFGTIMIILMLPIYIYFALSLMTIAKKLGVNNAWLAWIPIANIVLLLQCADLNLWLILLMIIPVVNIIGMFFLIYAWMKIAERRGFESWIGILTIVPVIGIAIPGYLAWAEPKASTK